MEKIVDDIILKYYGNKPEEIKPLGGGFYGRVFFAKINKPPYNLIVKIYLFPKLAMKEATQLEILRKYSLVKMPIVYHVFECDNLIQNDILLMEYIPGINAGTKNLSITKENFINITNLIVDNLISYHNIINEKGFGEINSINYELNWNNYYKKKAEEIMMKAEKMFVSGKINEKIISIMNKAIKHFDKIFYLPICTARLIHGDYNTWNVLLDKQLTKVEAIIDPMNCSWADSELDLYQLNNANGKDYSLLEKYASKFKLSENYKIKIAFYEIFNEIMHFHDANIDTGCNMDRFNQEANDLNKQMQIIGI